MRRNTHITWSLSVAGVVVALLVFLSLDLWGQDRRSGRMSRPAPGDTGVLSPSEDGKTAAVSEGYISVLDFLRFMGHATGYMVVYPSTTNDPQFQKDMRINVLHDIDPMTPAVAVELLEANGYELYETRSPNGRTVLHVSHGQARQRVRAPQAVPIVKDSTKGTDLGDEMLAALCLQLEHADTQLVITALRELLGITGRAGGTVSVVNISSTSTLIIQGKVRILRQIEDLVAIIDRPGTKAVIRVIDIQHADPTHVAEVLTNLLKNRRGLGTYVVADARASKILIESRDPDRLQLLEEAIRGLDVPPVREPPPAEVPAPGDK